ncbi:MAG: outer spore coat protein CotE [Firmicutes bacterium]|nr:outer spore coat protein CotE [Bacillota bacterium]
MLRLGAWMAKLFKGVLNSFFCTLFLILAYIKVRGDYMAAYKEIVTKAIIGKGKKYFKNNYSISVSDNPTTVLGCWVINHKFKGYKSGEKIGVDGSYDVNIWYSYENDSKTTVVNKKVDYNDIFNVKIKENADLTGDTDIIVRTLKQPTCSKVNIEEDGTISFVIEKELGVEIVGETKMKIAIEEDEEPWDEIDDEVTDDDLKNIDENINDNYIE